MKSIMKICLLIAFILAFGIFTSAKAFELGVPSNDSAALTVSESTTIDDNYFAFGSMINLYGLISGDLIAGGNQLEIGGTVGNNLFAAGNTVTIKGNIARDVFVGGANVIVTKDAIIEGDLNVGAGSLLMDGYVKGNLRTGTGSMDVNGKVDGSIYSNTGSMTFGPLAIVKGDVVYTSENDAKIDSLSQIAGNIEKKQPVAAPNEIPAMQKFTGSFLSLLSALLAGVLLLSIFPKKSKEIAENISNKFWPSLGIGFLTLVVVPAAFIMLLIILIGAPIALILLALYIFAMYIAKVFVGLCFGNYISKNKWSPLWAMTLGVFLLFIVEMIPYIGPLSVFVVILLGLGSITLLIFSKK